MPVNPFDGLASIRLTDRLCNPTGEGQDLSIGPAKGSRPKARKPPGPTPRSTKAPVLAV